MNTNLTPELQKQIEQEAGERAEGWTDRMKSEIAKSEYYIGATVYAEKWQEEKELRERYEKALKAIAKPIAHLQQKAEKEGASLNGHFAQELARSAAFLQSLADEALNPKTSTDETDNG